MIQKDENIYSSTDAILTLCDSISSVLTTVTQSEIRYAPLVQVISKTVLSPDIGTFVMFTGSFSGMVVLNFPKETAMELYTKYMQSMGMPESEIAKNYTQEEVSNTLGELTNQIIGNFTSKLNEALQIRINPSQPKMLVLPREVQLNITVNLDNPKYGKITFQTEGGNVFYLEMATDDIKFVSLSDQFVLNKTPESSIDDIVSQFDI